MKEDARLSRLTKICLSLPEAVRAYNGRHAAFTVRARTFAYYLDNHRGDEGIVGVVCKAPWGANDALVASDPDRFYKPAYVGPKGWVGLRLDKPSIDWSEVADLVADSYVLVAPRRLAALVSEDGSAAPARPSSSP